MRLTLLLHPDLRVGQQFKLPFVNRFCVGRNGREINTIRYLKARIICTTVSDAMQDPSRMEGRHAHACRLFEQDMKAFLRKMVVVAEDVCQALMSHHLH